MIQTELLKVLLVYFSSMVKIRQHTFWSCLLFNFGKKMKPKKPATRSLEGRRKKWAIMYKKNFLRGIIQLKVNRLVKFVFPFVNPFGL